MGVGENERRINILLVDDEPIGADDMSDLLRDSFGEKYGVDVRTAYSARRALEMNAQRPCDILVSDIQMPGMTGLELVRELRQVNPGVEVLFLTGYDDFSYAYEAFRQNATHYLLKTEGDEVILRSVEESICRLRERRQMAERVREAESRYMQAFPAYRHQLVLQALMGDIRDEALEDVAPGRLYVIAARLGKRRQGVETRERLVALSAVRDIVETALDGAVMWAEDYGLDAELVWIFATRDDAEYAATLFHLVNSARKHLEERLSMNLFFVVSEGAVDIRGLGGQYVEIHGMLLREISQDEAGAAIRRGAAPQGAVEAHARQMSQLRPRLELCQRDARDGLFEEMQKQAEPLMAYLRAHPAGEDLFSAEIRSVLEGEMIGYVNRSGQTEVIRRVLEEAADDADTLEAMMRALGRTSQEQLDHAARSIARYVMEYVHAHINEDISISALAEITGYSSGYLSRVFKQQEGVSIHDYVTRARIKLAEELLCNTNLRVYEIASNCGYDNAAYFIKVFKANTGLTPQEYKQDAKRH